MKSYLGEDLILVLSAPRSGSTMLQRILGSHSAVQTHPEPHILTPLAFQGYFCKIERARYNHRVAAQALSEFVDFLPRKEDDYLDACREYCRVLYGRAREVNGKSFFLDKTPNYADTILWLIPKLLPNARMVVLTRHPIAQLASTANTFSGGNFHKAYANRDCFSTFIPSIASFLRSEAETCIHVRYEDLVQQPEREIRRLLGFLDLPFERECLTFGNQNHITKSFGDPKIGLHKAPVDLSVSSWVQDLLFRPDRERLCRKALSEVGAEDLRTFGYPLPSIWQPLELARGQAGTPTLIQRMSALRLPSLRYQAQIAVRSHFRRQPPRRVLSRVQRFFDRLLGSLPA